MIASCHHDEQAPGVGEPTLSAMAPSATGDPGANAVPAIVPVPGPIDAGMMGDAGVTMPPADAAMPVVDGPTMPSL